MIFGPDIVGWRAHAPITLIEDLKDGELSIYFDCGIEDEFDFYDQALFFHDRLDGAGIHHRFEAVDSKHNEALWKERVKESLRFRAKHFWVIGVYPIE
jgi:enterochelin esterase-like enzyme